MTKALALWNKGQKSKSHTLKIYKHEWLCSAPFIVHWINERRREWASISPSPAELEQQTGSSVGQGLKSDQRPALVSAPDQRGRKLDNNEEGLKGGLFVVTCLTFFGGGISSWAWKSSWTERGYSMKGLSTWFWVIVNCGLFSNSYEWQEFNKVTDWKWLQALFIQESFENTVWVTYLKGAALHLQTVWLWNFPVAKTTMW